MKKENNITKRNRSASAVWIAIAFLMIFELCSLIMVASNLSGFARERARNYISLTESGGATKVKVFSRGKVPEVGSLSRMGGAVPANEKAVTANGTVTLPLAASFRAYDKDTVWQAETDVEIFKLRYDNNGDLVYTVNSENADKVIAPGTENVYGFTLENEGDAALDYTLSAEAYFVGKGPDGNDLWIPVDARLSDYTGEWLVGGADEWPDVRELNTVNRSGVIGAGKIYDYFLEWRWSYERGEGDTLELNDRYDTSLGDLAVDGPLELHIKLMTTATLDEDPTRPGGQDNPKTGDNNEIYVWTAISGVSAVLLAALLIGRGKDGKKRGEEQK